MDYGLDETTVADLLRDARRSAAANPVDARAEAKWDRLVLTMQAAARTVRFTWPHRDARTAVASPSIVARLLGRVAALPSVPASAEEDENAGGPRSWTIVLGEEADDRVLDLLCASASPGVEAEITMPGPGWDAGISIGARNSPIPTELSHLSGMLPSTARVHCVPDRDGVPVFRMDARKARRLVRADVLDMMRKHASLFPVLQDRNA